MFLISSIDRIQGPSRNLGTVAAALESLNPFIFGFALDKNPQEEYTGVRYFEEVRELFGLGSQELIIILAIVFLIFGAKRLPEIGSGLGKAIKNFKGGVKSIEEGTQEKPSEKPKEEAQGPGGPKPV